MSRGLELARIICVCIADRLINAEKYTNGEPHPRMARQARPPPLKAARNARNFPRYARESFVATLFVRIKQMLLLD
jgi:hypothetical protein